MRETPLERVHEAVARVRSSGGSLVWYSRVDPRTGDELPLVSRAAAIVDFKAWQCLIDYGSFAQFFDGRKLLSGTSDSPLDEFVDPITPFGITPLTLFAIAEGAVAAELDGCEVIQGLACDRLLVRCDLSRTVTEHRAVDAPHLLPDPAAICLGVWIDSENKLRRLHWQPAYQPFAPTRLVAEQVEPITSVREPQMNWSLLAPLREQVEEVEMTHEELAEFNQLIEKIERLGPPQPEK